MTMLSCFARMPRQVAEYRRLDAAFARREVCLLVLSGISLGASVHGQVVRQVNLNSAGVPGNGLAVFPSVSADGRYVAFETAVSNFAPGDTGFWFNIYVHDCLTGQTIWASPMPDGTAGLAGGANNAAISGDGMFVAFNSPNPLVLGDTGWNDVFVRDLATSTTIRASQSFAGGQTDGQSVLPGISGDGRFVAFLSTATNIVAIDANGPMYDVFVRDMATATTELVHVSSGGVQGNNHAQGGTGQNVSPDGRFVAFQSFASNLVSGDTNGARDVFVRDRFLNTTERVNITFNGAEANHDSVSCSMSDDGRFVAFTSTATNLVPVDINNWSDVFVRDRLLGTTELVNIGVNGIQARNPTTTCEISGNGRYVCFQTTSHNLVPTPTGLGFLYVRDLWSDATRIVDINATGANADQGASIGVFSSDGHILAYASKSNNLAPYPPNNWNDIFAVRHEELSPAVYCTATTSSNGCLASIAWTGTPSATSGTGFDVTVNGLTPQRSALLLYSKTSSAAIPSLGGLQCLLPPFTRTPIALAQGANPCGGAIALDFNAWVASGVDPMLRVGQSVWVQCWSRDPLAVGAVNLSDALFFVIDP